MEVTIKLDLSGIDDVHKHISERLPDLQDALSEELVAVWQDSFDESPRTGRTYQRGKETHTSSSPGNPPVVDTGALRASLHWRKNRKYQRQFYGAEYGLYLNDSAILDRPWIEPGIDTVVRESADGIAKAILEK